MASLRINAFQVNDEIGADELVRRLKQLAHTFQVHKGLTEINGMYDSVAEPAPVFILPASV